jgi:hypothetical protein
VCALFGRSLTLTPTLHAAVLNPDFRPASAGFDCPLTSVRAGSGQVAGIGPAPHPHCHHGQPPRTAARQLEASGRLSPPSHRAPSQTGHPNGKTAPGNHRARSTLTIEHTFAGPRPHNARHAALGHGFAFTVLESSASRSWSGYVAIRLAPEITLRVWRFWAKVCRQTCLLHSSGH